MSDMGFRNSDAGASRKPYMPTHPQSTQIDENNEIVKSTNNLILKF